MVYLILKHNRRALLVVLALFISAGCDDSSPAKSEDTAPVFAPTAKGLIIPAYFYPTWWDAETNLWDEVALAAAKVPIVAIINPNSGPGTETNADYQRVVTEIGQAGGRLIGYVHTSYTERDQATVLAEVDLYYDWYGVDGIFFDEITNDGDPAHLAYYQACFDRVRGHDAEALVVLNPGTDAPAEYLDVSTQMLIFEKDHANNPLTAWTPSAWVGDTVAQRVSVLAHNVPDAAAMQAVLTHADAVNAGWFYITDDVLPNPWDTLPGYWEEMVEAVRELNE
jgi:hypothetical protein